MAKRQSQNQEVKTSWVIYLDECIHGRETLKVVTATEGQGRRLNSGQVTLSQRPHSQHLLHQYPWVTPLRQADLSQAPGVLLGRWAWGRAGYTVAPLVGLRLFNNSFSDSPLIYLQRRWLNTTQMVWYTSLFHAPAAQINTHYWA